MMQFLLKTSQYGVIILSVFILVRCLRSMLRERVEPEIWAYIRAGRDVVPVCHWENIIGRGRSADIRVFGSGIGRTHAILRRSDNGVWTVYDVFSKGGVWVNGLKVPDCGEEVSHGDIINLGGACVHFVDISEAQLRKNEALRTATGKLVSPSITLLELSVLQAFLLIQHTFSADKQYLTAICLSFGAVVALEWIIFAFARLMKRSGFEIETLAFYLTSIGLSVAASSTPADIYKQLALIAVSVILFLFGGWWLRNMRRTNAMRIPVAVLALGLLAVNAAAGTTINGATNWLTFGGYSFQPSELVKVGYIYVGAAMLHTLYKRKNLYSFIAFSAICVIVLALIGDFGTALVFFVTFLVISFMRSGSIATVLLAVSSAVIAGFMALSVKPYIAQRFSSWGHVWEDVYDKGYQQTRAISAAASGGLIGKGAGAGWFKNIVAADTDMVFSVVAEELGLIVAVTMVLAVILMAFFAFRSTKNCRSCYHSIAACATMSMLLIQLALNVFGTLDMLPFTGVTFPFVSRGGSSLISCWMLMGFLKSADNRRSASFAVRAPVNTDVADFDDEEEEEFEDGEDGFYEDDEEDFEESDGEDFDEEDYRFDFDLEEEFR